MKTRPSLSVALRAVFEHPSRGVVGIVDDLLSECREKRLQLDWLGGRCRIRTLTNGTEEVLDLPLRKSVFRAILARVAAICNERQPNAVSPYGGQCELAVGPDPAISLRVMFANTTDHQRLELIPATALHHPDEAAEGAQPQSKGRHSEMPLGTSRPSAVDP